MVYNIFKGRLYTYVRVIFMKLYNYVIYNDKKIAFITLCGLLRDKREPGT